MKRKRRLQKKYIFRRVLALVFFLVLALAFVYFFFRVQKVEVRGLDGVKEKTVLDLLDLEPGQSYLFLNTRDLEDDLARMDLVESASISFEPLNKLVIDIREEVGLAQTYAGGTYYSINKDLVPFDGSKKFNPDLMTISGLPASQIQKGTPIFSDKKSQVKADFFKSLLTSDLIDSLKSCDILERGLILTTKNDLEIWVYSYQEGDYKIRQMEEILAQLGPDQEEVSTIILDRGDNPVAVKEGEQAPQDLDFTDREDKEEDRDQEVQDQED